MTGIAMARLATVGRLLNEAGVRYVIVGGFAMALHGVVRATKDVDVLLEQTRDNAALALDALGQLPMAIAEEISPDEVVAKPITIIGDDPRVDLLTLAWSVRYDEAIVGAQHRSVDGVVIPFAGIDALIRSKQTGRLQDQADIAALEELRRLQ
jgi:hypothetical protein